MVGEYRIKVDEASTEDILKLCKRELRPAGRKLISPDNLLEVLRPVAEQLVGVSEIFGLPFRLCLLRGSIEVSEVELNSLVTVFGVHGSIRCSRRGTQGGLVRRLSSAG